MRVHVRTHTAMIVLRSHHRVCCVQGVSQPVLQTLLAERQALTAGSASAFQLV